jgi:hypothetical protein
MRRRKKKEVYCQCLLGQDKDMEKTKTKTRQDKTRHESDFIISYLWLSITGEKSLLVPNNTGDTLHSHEISKIPEGATFRLVAMNCCPRERARTRERRGKKDRRERGHFH